MPTLFVKLCAPLLGLCLIITGCGTVPQQESKPSAPPKEEANNPGTLLRQAQSAAEPERSQLLLQAARLLDRERKPQEALAALDQARANLLTVPEQERFILLGAKLSIATGQGQAALEFLKRIQPPLFQQTDLKTQQRLSELRAQAHTLSGDNLMSAMERVYAAGLYSGDAYWRNHEQIWNTLIKAPRAELQLAFDESIPGELKGWLELALLMRRQSLSLDEQLRALQEWQRKWPQHPAAQRPPEELKMLAELREERPRSIALALPLSGPLAAAGTTIRDGFLTAYYADPQRKSNQMRVDIIDSAATSDFASLYQSLPSDQYDLLIGPLDKQAVDQLARLEQHPIPVLALNYSDVPRGDRQTPFYQFGLAIEDEIAQTVDQAWNNGHRRAAIIVPDTAWGQRAQQAFSSNWQQRGGTVLKTAMLVGNADYSKEIKDLLAVEESQQRSREISQLIGENVRSDPRSRHDIDCIFLAAPPIIARQVKPLLAFHYGGNIPVYATSQVFSGRVNPSNDQDLDGIFFVDLPWILREDDALKQQMLSVWQEQAVDRLAAFGVDAYQLAPRLQWMQQFPDRKVQGATGTLTLGGDQQVRRRLDWARFRAGRPVPAEFSQIVQP